MAQDIDFADLPAEETCELAIMLLDSVSADRQPVVLRAQPAEVRLRAAELDALCVPGEPAARVVELSRPNNYL